MTNGRDKNNKVKKGVRDTYLEGLQRVIGHELPGYENLSKQEAEEARHIFDLQFKQLSQDMIDAGENPLKPEKRHVDFLLEPIDDWLRYLRYRTVFKKDNQRYGRFLSKLAWEDLSIYIANSFYKKHKYLPYQIITKEDLRQEAHLALLMAEKDYRADKGTITSFYFTAIYNHFYKLYQEANAEQRKSESKDYHLQYISDYSEVYQEPDPGIFKELYPYKDDDENIISFKREKANESFDVYDEQEYNEPDEVDPYTKQDFGRHNLGYILPGYTRDPKRVFSIDGFKKINLPPGLYEAVSPNRKTFVGEVVSRKGKIEQSKITIREFMKNAEKRFQLVEQLPDFYDLKQETWKLIQSFTDERKQFFELFYSDDNVKLVRYRMKKVLCNSFKVDTLGDEMIVFTNKAKKDVRRVMGVRNDIIKPLNDNGIQYLRDYFIGCYGVNVIRDTSDRKVKNKTYYFRTNFQVRELFKKQSVILYMKGVISGEEQPTVICHNDNCDICLELYPDLNSNYRYCYDSIRIYNVGKIENYYKNTKANIIKSGYFWLSAKAEWERRESIWQR